MTKLHRLPAVLVTATIVLSAAGPAFAVTSINNLNHRPVDQIAAELNITPEVFEQCFVLVSPAPPGSQPTGSREQDNKALLLPCLQQANAEITNSRLDAVMDKYRGVRVN